MRGNTVSEEIHQVNCKFDGELPVEAPAEDASEEKSEDKRIIFRIYRFCPLTMH